jgi:hypothetical protein
MKKKLKQVALFGTVMVSLMLAAATAMAIGISDTSLILVVPVIGFVAMILLGDGFFRLGMAGMAGTGPKVFSLEAWNPRNMAYQTTNYTALLTDDAITMNGANLVLTLPLIGSLQGTVLAEKVYSITNLSTSPLTVNPSATVDPVLNAKNTINAVPAVPGASAATQLTLGSTFIVLPNQTIVIAANQGDGNWQVVSPYPVPALKQVPFVIAVLTNGTTAVNVFDAGGAPVNMTITGFLIVPLATAANTLTLAAGANTIDTAVGATAGVPVGDIAAPVAAYKNVVAGTALTVVGSSANNAIAYIYGMIQQYA